MTANTEISLSTNFSTSPYYDDWDPENSFYRILFKPEYPVQARELTQIQTIGQSQLARFGKHVFKEGSIVIPGQFSVENDIDYVRINDLDTGNNTVDITDYENQILTSNSTGVKAYVLDVVDGTQGTSNTKTVFVRYTSAGSSNTQIATFSTSENLTCNVGTLVTANANVTGKGSRFVITNGVVFAKGFFISFPTQSIILDKYGITPTCKVGFTIAEEIVTSSEDISLFDPALESSNFSAPGADRLKLTATLTKLDVDDPTGLPDFVELFTIRNGVITEIYERSQYNIIRDELAKRTLDESGDYYVKGFGVRVRENYDTGTNGGYSATGNSQLLSVGVEPGTAYVKGYEVNKLVTEYITTTKSTTYSNISTQIATTTMGNFLECNEFMGYVEHDKGSTVQLRDVASTKLSTGNTVLTAATGNVIGIARLKNIEYDSGILGTPSGNVNIYLADIKMNGSNSFVNTRSLHVPSQFFADVILSDGKALLRDSASDALLYYIGNDAVRNVKDSGGNPSVTFNFNRSADLTLLAAGSGINLPISTIGETFPYGTVASLSDADKRDIILTIKDSSFNIAGSGTVANSGNITVVGSGTYFTRFNLGDKVEFSGNSKTYVIASIANDTVLTVSTDLPYLSGNSHFKAYKAGDQIDLTGKGFAAGTERDVSATSTQLTFDLKETFPTDISGSVTYQASRADGREAAKTITANVYVKINCDSGGTSGPYSLGIADIYKLRKVVKKSSSFPSSLTDGTDITTSFILDNGQRDNMYDFGTITPKPGTGLANTDRLLVQVDSFVPSFASGLGYFSIDSYPINDSTTSDTTIRTETIPVYKSPSSGRNYSLRNYIDFRPVKANVAALATTVGAATENPASTGGFTYEANGLRLPVPSTQFTFDYSYYMSRIDLLVINSDGILSIIGGIPSDNPITPSTPENAMALASIWITPYPSLAPNYSQLINRRDLGVIANKKSNIRFTMRDIGVLKNRIVNLEYYASLSLLEKSAIDMKILDEDGLDRFKNGIYVNTFRDHSLGDIRNRDYKIVVDKDEMSIRPIYTMHSHQYDYSSGSGVTRTGDLITLPYTHVAIMDQQAVTSTRNIELTSYRFIGRIDLYPGIDTWIDTNFLEDDAIGIGPDANNLPQGVVTEWNEWQKKVTGYQVDPVPGGNLKRIGHQWRLGGFFTPDQFDPSVVQPYNSGRDQRVVEYTEASRTGTETTYSIEESSQRIGNRVVDVGLHSYIRPQTIRCEAFGVKANTRMHVFFDGEDMDDYVTPLTQAEFDTGESIKVATTKTYSMGDPLNSTSTGRAHFLMELSTDKRFTVGTKELVVTDSPTNAVDASTYAKSFFVAQGLIQQKQDTILTTRQAIQISRPLSETVVTVTEIGYIDNPSCSAYSFIPRAPKGEEGLFLTKADIYFSAKHPTLGLWIEIREMDNAGGITRNQVPFSAVWVDAEDLTISTDGYTNPHTFTFPSPIFLYSDKQYALVIHTEGINPDTYFWISRLGETDLRTGQQHTSRPLTGTFYTTNNNLNWDIVPDIDLKCTLYRASFTTGATGEAILVNKPIERVKVTNLSAAATSYGEGWIGNYRLELTGNTGSIALTDVLVGANTGANSSVISISGSTFTVPNTSYTTGERVNVYYSSNLVSKGISSVITSITSANAVLSNYSTYEGNTHLEFVSSSGKFYVGDLITGIDSGVTANVASIENFRYSVVDFEPTYLTFGKTSITFKMQPTSNASVQGSYFDILDNDNYQFSTEQALLSRTNEIASLSSDYSNKIKVLMSTTTDYLSPVFDVGRAHSIYVDNIINVLADADVSEANTSGGNLINRFISEVVTLAEGQDAEDLRVVLTAYRPPNTDVRVWAKVLNAEDSETMAQKAWFELTNNGDSTYSSLSNRKDFKEYSYTVPTSMLTGPVTDNSPGGELQYTNESGVTFTGYKYFAIKIGLEASNSAIVPRVGDLRVIALQI